MKNDTHTPRASSSICFSGKYFKLFIALFIALTATSSSQSENWIWGKADKLAGETKKILSHDIFTRCHSYFCWIFSLGAQFPSISEISLQTLQL